MAANTYDFVEVGVYGGPREVLPPTVQKGAVAAGAAASITAGDICVYANGYWAKSADGGCAADGMYGLAINTSTDTVGADGVVSISCCPGGALIVRGLVTTSGNLAQAILGDQVTLDVAAGVQTIDENDPNGILAIMAYNTTTGTADVLLPYALDA